LEEPGTLRWRQSASPKKCKIFTKLRGVTFPKIPLISSAVRTLVAFMFIFPHWRLYLSVVRRFKYASNPERYTSGSVATGRASLDGQGIA
jgi:hypothetical protein